MTNEQDFDALYAANVHRLTGQLYLLTGDREEAHDCVQEAFERAWLRWSSVSRADSPEAWVRTVARRLAVSRWRKARNALTAEWRRSAGARVTEDHGPGAADRVALVRALQALPEVQRTALVLHHLCDLDVAAVAEETGATVSAVKTRLARGRRALADLLGDVRPDDLTTPADAAPGRSLR